MFPLVFDTRSSLSLSRSRLVLYLRTPRRSCSHDRSDRSYWGRSSSGSLVKSCITAHPSAQSGFILFNQRTSAGVVQRRSILVIALIKWHITTLYATKSHDYSTLLAISYNATTHDWYNTQCNKWLRYLISIWLVENNLFLYMFMKWTNQEAVRLTNLSKYNSLKVSVIKKIDRWLAYYFRVLSLKCIDLRQYFR